MKLETRSAEFQNNVVNDINTSAEDAYEKMLQKKAQYEASMKQLGIFKEAKEVALKKFKSAKSNAKKDNDSSLLRAQSEYTTALGCYTETDMNTDILRSSLQDSIFYSGKMNNSALIANARFA